LALASTYSSSLIHLSSSLIPHPSSLSPLPFYYYPPSSSLTTNVFALSLSLSFSHSRFLSFHHLPLDLSYSISDRPAAIRGHKHYIRKSQFNLENT
jgi:hypothetical protein